MAPLDKITKTRYFSKNFVLPPSHESHPIIKLNLFKWSLLPEMPADQKRIVTKCTLCHKKYYFNWKRNWTTLKLHYESVHNLTLERVKMEAKNSPAPDEWTILGSSLFGSSGVYRGSHTIDDYLPQGTSENLASLVPGRKRGPVGIPFDKAEYERLMLMMIVKNDLSFTIVESESFKALIFFLRDDAPTMSRHTLRRRLKEIFDVEFDRVKRRLDGNTGIFAITIDEWRSGNGFDFLGITLHFYNNQYDLENYTIGFEALNEKTKYTGEVLYDFMMEVLTRYGIEKRIVSITRDNAGPMNVMMSKFKKDFAGCGIRFEGDIRCVGHVLNLSTEALLHYTHFKVNGSQKFEKSMETLLEKNPLFKDFAHRMKHLPRVMRLIILQINYSHKMKNGFRTLVKEKKANESTKSGPEKMLRDNDTRWLSTYRMIDRFIHFETEITSILRLHYGSFSESTADLEKFQLTTEDWSYLKCLRDVLQIFRAPTLRLQASSYPTINQTIPMIFGVSSSLECLKNKEVMAENPLIVFGLQEARNKLLEYYPLHEERIESNKMLYISIVLDPRYKLAIFDSVSFPEQKIREIKDHFLEAYLVYKTKFKDTTEVLPVDPNLESPEQFGSLQFHWVEETIESDESEAERYLREPRQPGCQDVIAFYKTQQSRFPILSRMARDYFAVAAMSAPSEALFSRIGNIVTKKRGRLLSEAIKMLAILKSRGIIKTDEMPDEGLESEAGEELSLAGLTDFEGEKESFELLTDHDLATDYEEELEESMNIFRQ